MRSARTAEAMVGVLMLAALAALLSAAVTFAAGAGVLAAALVFWLSGTTLLTGWTGFVLLSERRPSIRRLLLAVHGGRRPA